MGFEDQQLECILSIQYPLKLEKHYTKVQVLLDSNSEINAITPTYTAKLGLRIYSTDIRAQKIDRSTFSTYGIVLVNFQLEEK